MYFEELNDDEWARISALAADEPVHPHRRGRPRAETRVVANAVLWILTTGERWSKLPARYPSGPTCRRRFDEWLADGTLFEMVSILSEGGRAFAYVPQPQAAVLPEPKPEPTQESPRLRGVFWTNPESWQNAGSCTQRAGDLPVAASRPLQTAGDALRAMHERRALGLPSFSASEVHERTHDYCGYTIRAMAQPVTRQTPPAYRASAEIAKDGKRIERSGLIGPRFEDHERAERHALEWARDWIDRQSSASVAASAAEAAASSEDALDPSPCGDPDQRGEAKDAAARPLPAPLSAIAPSIARRLDSAVGRRALDWLPYPEGHLDLLTPVVNYRG
jgi:transposase